MLYIMQRIVFIDIAKAICIILVVVGHYIPDNSPEWYVALHDIIYTFHMPLFMFASGYVYIATKRDVGYGEFLIKKIRRLMVPYLATSVIIITIKLLTQGSMSVDNPVTLVSFLRMFYLPEAGYFLWFIWALWWMFVIVPLFKTKTSRLLFFFICFVLHFIPLSLPEEFCLSSCKHMLVFFMFGVVAYEQRLLHWFVNAVKWRNAVAVLCLFMAVQYAYYANGGKNTLISAVLPYAGIFFVVEFSKLICRYCKDVRGSWLMVVASSSYIIYLFHTTFEGFAKAVFRKLLFDTGLWYVFVPEAIIVVGCGVVMPVLLYYIIKKYRITRLLFGL